MTYIDMSYYQDVYEGTEVDASSFPRLEKRSREIIDILTNYKIHQVGIENLAEFIKQQVKLATAAQIEYLVLSGEDNAVGSSGYGQVNIGNFSYGDRQGSEALSRIEAMTTQKVISLLLSTGLLYAGVDVYD